MSTVDTHAIPSAAPIVLEKAAVRNWKPPIALGIFAIISVLIFVVGARREAGKEIATFRLSTDTDVIQLPPILANVTIVTTTVIVLLFLIAAASAVLAYRALSLIHI